MQPPARNTRSKASPGLVDLPGPRRSSTIVAQEKAIRQQAAVLKAEESRRRAQQVSEVEGEIKRAQAEANVVRQGGGGNMTKRIFQRPDGDVSVSSWPPCIHRLLTFSPLILATKTNRNKRKVDTAGMHEPGPSKATRASKYVSQANSLFTNSPSDHSRIMKSNSPHSHQDIALNKPSGLTLGAEGVLPGRHIVSLLRVFEQCTHLIPSEQMLSSFKTYSPL